MYQTLKNTSSKKFAILTGSSGQLGSVFTKILKKNNFYVIGLDIVISKNVNYFFKTNLESSSDILDKISKIKKKFKKIDLLINNAGAQIFSPIEKRTTEEIDYVFSVNLKANIILSNSVFTNFFKKQKKGKIINIGSVYGVVSGDMKIYKKNDRKTSELYAATKAGVIHLTKYYASYMAKYKISVNCISPGGVINKAKQTKRFIKKYSEKVPLSRMADDKKDIGKVFDFVVNAPDYLTGQNLIVDGGFSII